NAVQVLPRAAKSVAALLESGVLQDPDPLVRLAALLALADLPPAPAAGAAVVAALGRAGNTADRWVPDAAPRAPAHHSQHLLRALAAGRQPSPKLLAAAGIVAEHYARGGPADSVGPVLAHLADAEPTVAEAVIRGFARGWPKKRPAKLDERVEKDLTRLAS